MDLLHQGQLALKRICKSADDDNWNTSRPTITPEPAIHPPARPVEQLENEQPDTVDEHDGEQFPAKEIDALHDAKFKLQGSMFITQAVIPLETMDARSQPDRFLDWMSA